ncbi:MAG: adenylyl-sulfate kinase [Nitrospirae bacterium]|nr:MAG: adenylyl-sulfate kinase [Nitrospirota bacterium]
MNDRVQTFHLLSDKVFPAPSPAAAPIVWFTGLSGSGKSTIAIRVLAELQRRGYRAEILDGDVVRKGLSKDLGFTRAAREEHLRRLGFLAELLSRNGIIVLVAAITPYQSLRNQLREQLTPRYLEVFVNAPLSVCEARDVKGLYAKARKGELQDFTGIDDPYDIPQFPELECRTDLESVQHSTAKVMALLEAQRYIKSLQMPEDSPTGIVHPVNNHNAI